MASSSQEKPYACPTCGNRFMKNIHLLSHIKWSHTLKSVRPFACTVANCGKTFQLLCKLNKHLVTHSDSRTYYMCHVCNKQFTTKSILKNHKETHKQQHASFTCDRQGCGKVFKKLDYLKQHKVTHSSHSRYHCSLCTKRFTSKGALKHHELFHDNEEKSVKKPSSDNLNKLKCDFKGCKKVFKSVKYLNRHKKIHSNVRRFGCPKCIKRFIYKSQLTSHLPTHSDEKRFKCGICGNRYKSKRYIKAHVVLEHVDKNVFTAKVVQVPFQNLPPKKRPVFRPPTPDPVETLYECPECDKTFKMKCTLEHHMSFHRRADETHMCDFPGCRREFTRREGLKQHKMNIHMRVYRCAIDSCVKEFRDKEGLKLHKATVHSQFKAFACPTCDKLFKYRKSLLAHERWLHGPQGPTRFPCPKCRKTFSQKHYIAVHLLTHVNEIFYKCFLCSVVQKFKEKRALYAHIVVTHADRNVKTYQCGFFLCEKKFPKAHLLNQHMLSHTEETPYACEVCKERFKTIDKLRVHRLSHGIVPDTSRIGRVPICKIQTKKAGDVTYQKMVHPLEKNTYDCNVPLCVVKYKHRCKVKGHKLLDYEDNAARTVAFSAALCRKKFDLLGDLTTHQKAHPTTIPFICSLCGEILKSKHHLTHHMFSHEEYQPFACDICDKQFDLEVSLKAHVAAHKKYRCKFPFCDAKFYVREELRRHRVDAHNAVDLVCKVCNERFKKEKKFLKHASTAHVVKAFACEVAGCGKRFKLQRHLTVHKKVHSEDSALECYICDRKFVSKSNLRRHVQAHINTTRKRLLRCKFPNCRNKYVLLDELNEHKKTHFADK